MFEKYTEKARRVIFFARFEASHYGSTTIDPEHLLLGLVREKERFVTGAADADSIRRKLEEHVSSRSEVPISVDLPFSDAAKKALDQAARESRGLGHSVIAPEHLVLGLLGEGSSAAARLLAELGIESGTIREALRQSTDFTRPVEAVHSTGYVDSSPEIARLFAHANEERQRLSSPSLGLEHLLLGLLRDETSLAARILREHGLDLEGVRERIRGGR